jgi:C4-dicarboxylate-specific signal transduction histidine kinase
MIAMAPHGYCLLWDPTLIWGTVASNALIALAYFTIPAALIAIVQKREDTGFNWVFWAFAAFIVSCGVSHLMHIWNLWHGNYLAEMIVLALTAIISMFTAIALWMLLPTIAAIPSNADLRRANKELQQSIDQRDRALEQLRKESAARQAAQSKAQLLQVSRLTAMGAMTSTIAHEINQPLTASANFLAGAATLARELGRPGDAVESAIARAQAQADRASEIIRRMRAFAQRGEIARTDERPQDLLDHAVQSFISRYDRKDIDIRINAAEGLPLVSVDQVHLEQVLLNLLRNAADAMRDQEDARIVLSATELDPAIEFVVTDNGPGLSPDEIENVFDLFNSSKSDGMGLGLSLCRTLIEAHGGTIWAENNADGGAKIVLRLPLKAQAVSMGSDQS